MADTSRFPEGVLLQSSLSVARPVGTLVLNNGSLYYSTNASVATYALVTGAAPVGSTLSRTLNVQTADSTVLNASTGGTQNFSDTYTIPANTLAVGDTLIVTVGGYVTRGGASFDLTLGLSVQSQSQMSFAVVGVAAGTSSWQLQSRLTVTGATAGRHSATATLAWDTAEPRGVAAVATDTLALGSTALVRATVGFSGSDAANVAAQTFRSVEIIKASS